MAPQSASTLRDMFVRSRGLIFPILIVASVLVIIAPLPALVLDLLLTCNVTLAVVILLTTIYVKRPLEFSVFPAILLGATFARLVLNVASTRLILTSGASQGTDAAGGVIEAFGHFVAGGELVVGLILFIILVTIQFLVITKGATRISEVAARFALDGMPGKQMAIDADLNAGVITQEQASTRRDELSRQADFYGAMDGASKFVRGDAIAGIVITLVNILGGLFIGMFQNGMSLTDAGAVFTKLTIGDGLVTQIPAFLIAIAAGLIVARSSSESNLPADVVGQLFHHPEAMFLAAASLVALSFTGLPAGPLITLALACAAVGYILQRNRANENSPSKPSNAPQSRIHSSSDDRLKAELRIDPLQLELGIGLLQLVDGSAGGDLLHHVTRVRQSVAQQLGFIVPKVRITDNIQLDLHQYQIKVRDNVVAVGEAFRDGFLAIAGRSTTGNVPGIDAVDPVNNRPALWIEPDTRATAEEFGYEVIEPQTVIASHLSAVVRDRASDLLPRQQVHQLLDNLKQSSPRLVDELVPKVVGTALLHQVLKNLLSEGISIRDLETILQALGDYAGRIPEPDLLTEHVRSALAGTICQQFSDGDGALRVITFDPAVENILTSGFDFDEHGFVNTLSPEVSDAFARGLAEVCQAADFMGQQPIVLCHERVTRAGIKRLTSTELPSLTVLCLSEISRDTRIEAIDSVSDDCFNSYELAVS